jgi:hypothetical protein
LGYLARHPARRETNACNSARTGSQGSRDAAPCS